MKSGILSKPVSRFALSVMWLQSCSLEVMSEFIGEDVEAVGIGWGNKEGS